MRHGCGRLVPRGALGPLLVPGGALGPLNDGCSRAGVYIVAVGGVARRKGETAFCGAPGDRHRIERVF